MGLKGRQPERFVVLGRATDAPARSLMVTTWPGANTSGTRRWSHATKAGRNVGVGTPTRDG